MSATSRKFWNNLPRNPDYKKLQHTLYRSYARIREMTYEEYEVLKALQGFMSAHQHLKIAILLNPQCFSLDYDFEQYRDSLMELTYQSIQEFSLTGHGGVGPIHGEVGIGRIVHSLEWKEPSGINSISMMCAPLYTFSVEDNAANLTDIQKGLLTCMWNLGAFRNFNEESVSNIRDCVGNNALIPQDIA